MRNGFIRASRLYDVESRTPIAHPAHQATDADVRRALKDREIRADGGLSSSGAEYNTEFNPKKAGFEPADRHGGGQVLITLGLASDVHGWQLGWIPRAIRHSTREGDKPLLTRYALPFNILSPDVYRSLQWGSDSEDGDAQ